ncbi:MAG: hypothetical protein K2N10_00750, partial [Muribaculaceae bacterium]|nr:hypothetical protein [Muribaculaceae bacterium]
MTSFIVICIFLAIWFLIIGPFVKLIRVSRRWSDQANAYRQRYQQQQQQSRQQQQPAKPKKKIDPTVGEYVEFTETTVRTTTTDGSTTTTTTQTEQQITDVTW